MSDHGGNQQAATDQDEIFDVHIRLPGRDVRPNTPLLELRADRPMVPTLWSIHLPPELRQDASAVPGRGIPSPP